MINHWTVTCHLINKSSDLRMQVLVSCLQDKTLDALSRKVEEVYHCCVAETEANLTTLQMLTAIEEIWGASGKCRYDSKRPNEYSRTCQREREENEVTTSRSTLLCKSLRPLVFPPTKNGESFFSIFCCSVRKYQISRNLPAKLPEKLCTSVPKRWSHQMLI